MTKSTTPDEKVILADDIELEAWEDMVAAAPPPFAEAVGLHAKRSDLSGPLILAARRIPTTMFNRVIGLGNHKAATESDIEDIIAAYTHRGIATFWVHLSSKSESTEIPTWLEARGFAVPSRTTWAKMLRGTAAPQAPTSSLRVRQANADEIPAFAAVIADAHGMPPAMCAWIEALARRPSWTPFGAFDGKSLVSAAMLYQRGERAWLGLGGTAPEHRNKGGQGLTMAARILHAIEQGAKHIATETGEPIGNEPNQSLANMVRLGFEKVCSRRNFEYGKA